ncbi:MAG: hypothetical protein ACLQFR_09485 [Streptosporangiaceae bacterium]
MAASTSLTPEQLSLRGRKAIHARWAKEDPQANAERGQAGLRARFDREVREAAPEIAETYRPDAAEAEYARRAEHAYKAHMAGLALASSKARGARKAGAVNAAT